MNYSRVRTIESKRIPLSESSIDNSEIEKNDWWSSYCAVFCGFEAVRSISTELSVICKQKTMFKVQLFQQHGMTWFIMVERYIKVKSHYR